MLFFDFFFRYFRVLLLVLTELPKMPFWKKRDSAGDASAKDGDNNKEKVNYKARLEHKQYLVS